MSQIKSPNNNQEKLLIDVGSTYFKLSNNINIEQHFRDFNKSILDDLTHKCGQKIERFDKKGLNYKPLMHTHSTMPVIFVIVIIVFSMVVIIYFVFVKKCH